MKIRLYVDPTACQPHIHKHSREAADWLPQTQA
jgi:hypothetical protein